MRYSAERSLRLAVRALAVGLGLVLSGCASAFENRHATLRYPPATAPRGPPPPVIVPTPETWTVAVVVTDARPEPREKVGVVRNGFGIPIGDVEIQEDAAPWVRYALEKELYAEGIPVVAVDVAKSVLSAQLLRLHCDAYFSYSSDVILTVDLIVGAYRPPSTSYTGEGSAGFNWASTEDSYSESMALALQSAVRQVAAQVKRALAPMPPPPPAAPPSS